MKIAVNIPEDHPMRHSCLSVGLAILLSTSGLTAEPASPLVSPGQPMILMASATARDGTTTLHVHTIQMTPTVLETVTLVPVKETVIVNGRAVEQTRLVEERRPSRILRPVPGGMIEATINDSDVVVRDLKGKPVTPANVAKLLKKETAVLVSFSGPVDPYYLQTTKPGTLIVQMPFQYLNAPTELRPPERIDPTEPPLAPVKPKPPSE